MHFAKLFINLNFSPFPVPFSPIYNPLRNAPNGHAYHKGVEVYDKGYKNTNIPHFVKGKNEFRKKCTNFLKALACSPIPP